MIEHIVNSVFNSITYIIPVGEEKDCWLVDCGDIERIIDEGWRVIGVLLTHSHSDHIYGLNTLVSAFPDALVYTNQSGKEGLLNSKWNFSRYHDDVEEFIFFKPESIVIVSEECEIAISDEIKVDVLFTPGHEPSCLSYKLGNVLFTGDSYIPGLNTVTIFPRSNRDLAVLSWVRLHQIETEYGCRICPGHKVK